MTNPLTTRELDRAEMASQTEAGLQMNHLMQQLFNLMKEVRRSLVEPGLADDDRMSLECMLERSRESYSLMRAVRDDQVTS